MTTIFIFNKFGRLLSYYLDYKKIDTRYGSDMMFAPFLWPHRATSWPRSETSPKDRRHSSPQHPLARWAATFFAYNKTHNPTQLTCLIDPRTGIDAFSAEMVCT